MNAFSRFLISLKNRGFGRTFWLIVVSYIYDRKSGYAVRRVFTPTMTPDSSFSYRRVTSDDLNSLEVFRLSMSRNEFRDLIERGEIIFIALKGDQPVAFHHCSPFQRTRPPFSYFQLAKGQIWIVDIFTHPDYRRQNLASSLRCFREHELLKLGFVESLSTIEEWNVPSLAYAQKAGIKSIQFFSFARFLWMTKFNLIPDARSKLESQLREHRGDFAKSR